MRPRSHRFGFEFGVPAIRLRHISVPITPKQRSMRPHGDLLTTTDRQSTFCKAAIEPDQITFCWRSNATRWESLLIPRVHHMSQCQFMQHLCGAWQGGISMVDPMIGLALDALQDALVLPRACVICHRDWLDQGSNQCEEGRHPVIVSWKIPIEISPVIYCDGHVLVA